MDPISTAMLAAVLAVSVWTDATRGTIPNILIIFGLIVALALALVQGFDGISVALVGAALGLIAFLPAYAWAGMGAGDVKLMAVVGSFVGPKGALLAVAASLIMGALIGVIVLLVRGGVQPFLRRYWQMFTGLIATGQFAYAPPSDDEAASRPLPYALAIALGTFWLFWYRGDWARFSDTLGSMFL